jgi:hypothetical protein
VQERLRDVLARIWPGRSAAEYDAVVQAAAGEAEQAAAGRLGTSPVVLSVLAHRLWGRGLSAERDRRVAEQGQAPPRTVQARHGHITRALLAELQDAYPNVKELDRAR